MTTQKLTLDTKVARNPDVAWRILGDFLIAITPSSNSVHRFNKTGADLWKALEKKGVTLTELVIELENLYDIDKASAEKDVKSFFQEVINKGIVTIEL